MPTGAPMPSCSSTTKSCGRTWRISRPLGSATALAASIARRTSSRVISRFFPATATTPRLLNALTCAPDRPRWTESISTPAVSSASSMAFLIDSTAASRLTTTPRRMPFDSASPRPMMSRSPPSVISPTMAAIFDVPTSSPTRYRSLRATPFLPGGSEDPPYRSFLHWPHVHALIEAQVHVVDLRHALAQRRRQIHVRLQALQEPVLADVQQRRIVLQHHDGVVRIVDVDLRDALRDVLPRRERVDDARGELGAL